MYIGVDFGGTKTIVAIFNGDGQIIKRHTFKTEGPYTKYLELLATELEGLGQEYADSQIVAMAVPSRIDYDAGMVRLQPKMGDGWGHERLRDDLAGRLRKQVIVENDANVGALGEAIHGAGANYNRMLYVTLSTGIGTGYVENKVLDTTLRSSEGGQMVVTKNGRLAQWEDVASGRAFTEKYGKQGSEVDDPDIWQEYARELAPGFINLLAIIQPEIVVIGGGMGAHLHKFKDFLVSNIDEYRDKRIDAVDLISADIPDDAVIYGCYELAKKT